MNQTIQTPKTALIARIALWLWSVLVLLDGLLTWIMTLGVVESTRFALQISLLNHLSMLMVWAALYAFWRTFGTPVPVTHTHPAASDLEQSSAT